MKYERFKEIIKSQTIAAVTAGEGICDMPDDEINKIPVISMTAAEREVIVNYGIVWTFIRDDEVVQVYGILPSIFRIVVKKEPNVQGSDTTDDDKKEKP